MIIRGYLNLPTKKRKKYFWLKWRKKSKGICLNLPLPIFIQKITLRPPFFSVPHCALCVKSTRSPPTWMRPLTKRRNPRAQQFTMKSYRWRHIARQRRGCIHCIGQQGVKCNKRRRSQGICVDSIVSLNR